MRPDYRPDIDGLRTVSALSFIFYHYGLGRFTGGFVGVDVFFVISGYLITSIIYREMEQDRFSILAFYDRRFRRILPATLLAIIGTGIVGYFVLLPKDFAGFGESAVYASFGFANFFFLWNTGGYFDSAADLMPLLHTWSLAVEEQFYFVWPLLLLLVFRFSSGSRTAVVATLALIIAVSLGASILIVERNQQVAFYMLHTRAWELAIGALLVFVPAIRHRLAAEALAVLGLALIAYGVFALTSRSPFPGLNALYPCVGAALLIWPTAQRTMVARALSLRPMVFIGLISFSLYLWHWPILVLYRLYGIGDMPGTYEKVALILLSILLATISLYAVENPIRRRRFGHHVTIPAGLSAAAVVAVCGYGIVAMAGIPSRLDPDVRYYASFLDFDTPNRRDPACFITSESAREGLSFESDRCLAITADKPNVLVIGDSHANHYVASLRQLYPGINFAQATASGCQPTIKPVGSKRCTNLMNDVFQKYVPGMDFDAVIVSARWNNHGIKKLRKSVKALKRHVAKVIVLGPTIEYRHELARLLAKSKMTGRDLMRESRRYEAKAKTQRAVERALSGTSATLVSVLDAVCPRKKCQVLTPEGAPLQWDYGHFTTSGATYALQKMKLPLPTTSSNLASSALH